MLFTFTSNIIMTSFQISVTATAEDIEGQFRTSLRQFEPDKKSSEGKKSEKTGSTIRPGSRNTKALPNGLHDEALLSVRASGHRSGSSNRDSAMDSLDSFRSSSFTSVPSKTRTDSRQGQKSQRQSRRTTPVRSRSRPVSRTYGGMTNGYDASLRNDAPLVTRFNQSGEMYPPVSHAWQAFKERLFDSSLSEKYETFHVDNTPPLNHRRRYRSISPSDIDESDLYEDVPSLQKKLIFLQDPLARSMYRNLETFFDRKNIIREAIGPGELPVHNSAPGTSRGLFSRQTSSNYVAADIPQRPNSALGFRSSNSSVTGRAFEPARSQSSMSSSNAFFGRRKKEQPQSSRAHSEERPEDVRKQIQQRFAKINFDEGTTDYDALFTVSEEVTAPADVENEEYTDHHRHAGGEGGTEKGHPGKDATPKSKLEHLRY